MPRPDVNERIDADLRAGHTYRAANRLASLLARDPADLDIRARLAAVARMTGDSATAGRWGFLTDSVTAAEIGAFETATDRVLNVLLPIGCLSLFLLVLGLAIYGAARL